MALLSLVTVSSRSGALLIRLDDSWRWPALYESHKSRFAKMHRREPFHCSLCFELALQWPSRRSCPTTYAPGLITARVAGRLFACLHARCSYNAKSVACIGVAARHAVACLCGRPRADPQVSSGCSPTAPAAGAALAHIGLTPTVRTAEYHNLQSRLDGTAVRCVCSSRGSRQSPWSCHMADAWLPWRPAAAGARRHPSSSRKHLLQRRLGRARPRGAVPRRPRRRRARRRPRSLSGRRARTAGRRRCRARRRRACCCSTWAGRSA